MKNLKFLCLICLAFFISHIAMAQIPIPPSEGDGSEHNPYILQSVFNLYWLSQTPTEWDKHFIQMGDFYLLASANWDNGKGWTPIGTLTATEEIPFTGTYNGGSYTIFNMTIHRPDDMGQGFFGVIGPEGVVKNLNLEGFTIAGSSVSGGLVGLNKGTIENCHMQGVLFSTADKAGGLVGENRGSITLCSTNTSVAGGDQIGGFVGLNLSGTIDMSYSEGSVSGTHYVGGFAGNNEQGIMRSYSIANVEAISLAGGFAGRNKGSFLACYARGNVTRKAGSTHTYLGGFIGLMDNYSTTRQCYSTGKVLVTDGNALTQNGFTGKQYWAVTLRSNFWNTTTSEQSATDGNAKGVTSQEMRKAFTFLTHGWDFVNEVYNGDLDSWNMAMGINNGFPFLAWQYPETSPAGLIAPSGQGTEQDPYLVANLEHLFWISMQVMNEQNNFQGKYFLQTHSVDAAPTQDWFSDKGWKPIGHRMSQSNPWVDFGGTYDGAGNTIYNLHINSWNTTQLGLFGQTSVHSTIKNLNVLDANMDCGQWSGILVGTNRGVIYNCHTSGIIEATTNVGGLVGQSTFHVNISNAHISHSSSAATVISSGYVGGFMAQNARGVVENCYATGLVRGDQYRGGFVARNYQGIMRHNYCAVEMETMGGHTFTNLGFANTVSTGDIFLMEGNFWDVTLSGQTSTAGVATGKSTEQMQKLFTFLVMGWDFAGETINGSEDIWNINENRNNGYPYHSMHFPEDSAPQLISPVGEGSSEADPWLIASLEDLFWISYNATTTTFVGKYFKQTQSIDATETALWFGAKGWLPIGSNTRRFSGQYDGNGNTIDGLTIDRATNYNGLFGSVSSAGVIQQVGLTSVDIKGSWYNGALAGALNWGNISECFAHGVVAGNGDVGGLVGNQERGLLINSFAQVDLLRPEGIMQNGYGGLVGRLVNGKVKNCYSTGKITATGLPELTTNGFVGLVEDGFFLELTNNFWDVEASEQASTGGMTGQYAWGRTTQQMQSDANFTSSGWDYICETLNGTQDIWAQNAEENNGYPFLVWQGYTPDQQASLGGNATTGSQSICPGGIPMDIQLTNYNGQIVKWQSSLNSTFSGTVTDYPASGSTLESSIIGSLDEPRWFRAQVQNGVCDAVFSELHHVNTLDDEAPVILSQFFDIEVAANDDCGFVIPDFTAELSATDNCTAETDLIITQIPVAGTFTGNEANHVIITVEDASGNMTQVSFNVSVTDQSAPSITSVHEDAQVAGDENCQAVLGDYTALVEAYDNCTATSELLITQIPAAGSLLFGAVNEIILRVTDLTGNFAEVSFNISVLDETDPEIVSEHSDLEVEAGENCQAILADYTPTVEATDNCSVNLTITQTPTPGTLLNGTTNMVVLRATDEAGNFDEVSFNIAVIDQTNPIITSNHEDFQLEANENCEALLPDFTLSMTATDNCTGVQELVFSQSPVAGTPVQGADNLLTLFVADNSGNNAQVSFNVAVVDTTDPYFECVEDAKIYLEPGQSEYIVQGNEFDPVEIYDNCGIAGLINNFNEQATLSGTVFSSGTYIITWTATDLAGNTFNCIMQIEVVLHVGLETHGADLVRVFPNPTRGEIMVQTMLDATIEIIDLAGKILYSHLHQDSQTMRVDISGYPAGMYFVIVRSETQLSRYKIIKQ